MRWARVRVFMYTFCEGVLSVFALCVKSSLRQGFCIVLVCVRLCVFGGSQQSEGRGEHLHTVAQAFCLYTRLLPSNASRPSRL